MVLSGEYGANKRGPRLHKYKPGGHGHISDDNSDVNVAHAQLGFNSNGIRMEFIFFTNAVCLHCWLDSTRLFIQVTGTKKNPLGRSLYGFI